MRFSFADTVVAGGTAYVVFHCHGFGTGVGTWVIGMFVCCLDAKGYEELRIGIVKG
jgi:hypothetical protein